MQKTIAYLDNAVEVLRQIRETQAGAIEDAVRLMFDRFQKGGSLFVFGASHAGIIAEEMYCRAGGLMVVNPIFNPTLMLNTRPFPITSAMERLEGFGNIILDGSAVKEGDVLILHSVSGRNSVAIDMALQARQMGVATIVITSITYSKLVSSRHSSGKLLYELGDVVIDNCGVFGDASIPIGESGISAGPTSTVTGAAIVNAMAAGFAELCDQSGLVPPVYISVNADVDMEKADQTLKDNLSHIHYL